MTTFKCIIVTSLAALVVEAAGVTAHHVYDQHLSSGYAPILKATLQSSHLEERAQYIHDARVAVRTVKDRETQAKLEKMQADLGGDTVSKACSDWKAVAELLERNWRAAEQNIELSRSNDAIERQIAKLEEKPYRARGVTEAYRKKAGDQEDKAINALYHYQACVTTNQATANKEGAAMYQELRATAGLPAN
jgi:hypothetical protein